MKTALKSLMTAEVHYLSFVFVCFLLVVVVLSALLIADDITSIAERAIQHANIVMPGAAVG